MLKVPDLLAYLVLSDCLQLLLKKNVFGLKFFNFFTEISLLHTRILIPLPLRLSLLDSKTRISRLKFHFPCFLTYYLEEITNFEL